jgi:hypothetical protein
MAINFTKPSNGYLFDLTGETGAGTLKPLFRFRATQSISVVDVYNDRISYKDMFGVDYNFSYDGTTHIQLLINGVASSSNLDLFNDLIALL